MPEDFDGLLNTYEDSSDSDVDSTQPKNASNLKVFFYYFGSCRIVNNYIFFVWFYPVFQFKK